MIVRLSAGAAAAAAVTAVAVPAPAPYAPQALPSLTASALAARYSSDHERVAVAARTATGARAWALATLARRQVLAFNPGTGTAVTVVGDLATATRVAILVPGADTSLNDGGYPALDGAATALATEAGRTDPTARLAVIAWLGYATPSLTDIDIATSAHARVGARALRPLVTTVAKRAGVALLCHSYGSVVCGLAAPHLPATDIAVYGSPGMDAASVTALRTPARVWACRAADDWISHVPHVRLFGLGFGQDPMAPAFGARRFACGNGGHGAYSAGVALRNLTAIALGRIGRVTS
jgi:hypothetical protein